MQSDNIPKSLTKREFITEKFHQKIENMVNAIKFRDEEDEVAQFLENQLVLPEPENQQTVFQTRESSNFEEMVAQYLKSKSKAIDPVFDLFQIIEDILSRYKKSITHQKLQQINKQLYQFAKQKQHKSSKKLSTSASDYSRSTSNIMDLYLLQIQQLNQKIKQLQQIVKSKDDKTSELQFKVFSLQSRIRKQQKSKQSPNTLLNPSCPKLQMTIQSSDQQIPKDLQTIRQQQQSLQLQRTKNILPFHSQLIENTQQSYQIKVQQGFKNNYQQQYEQGQKSVAFLKCNQPNLPSCRKASTQSEHLQNIYDLQFQIHKLNLDKIKQQKIIDDLIVERRLFQQQMKILKKQKDYYFKQLKYKQSQVKKNNRVIEKLIENKK